MRSAIAITILAGALIGAAVVKEQPEVQAEPPALTQEQFAEAKFEALAERVKALEEELAATKEEVAGIRECTCELREAQEATKEAPKQTAPKALVRTETRYEQVRQCYQQGRRTYCGTVNRPYKVNVFSDGTVERVKRCQISEQKCSQSIASFNGESRS